MKSLDSYRKVVRESDSCFVTLSGGLGNQLFQYCFAQHLSDVLRVPVYLDVSLLSLSHKSENSRPSIQSLYGKKLLQIDSIMKISAILANHSMYFSHQEKSNFRSFISKVCLDLKLNFVQQTSMIFDSSIKCQERSYYFGSYATHEYWSSSFDSRMQEVNKSLVEYISMSRRLVEKEPDVVVHARRGDYARNPKTRRIHGVYGINYYLKVLSNLSNIKRREIVILSDDTHFALLLKIEIERMFGAQAVKLASSSDPLYILAKYRDAKVFIGCNSTFSWWLAYLGPDKLRFLPTNWFDEGKFGFDRYNYFPLETNLISFPFEK